VETIAAVVVGMIMVFKVLSWSCERQKFESAKFCKKEVSTPDDYNVRFFQSFSESGKPKNCVYDRMVDAGSAVCHSVSVCLSRGLLWKQQELKHTVTT